MATRWAATCDEHPDWQHVALTRKGAQHAANRHAGTAHSEQLRTGDIDGFVRAHAGLAHYYARKAGVHDGESYDDVYADALIGLWDAAKRYDPDRGVTFIQFAAARIVGEIADARRQRDPVTRHHRRKGAASPVSLDLVVADEHQPITLGDLLPDPHDDITTYDDADELNSWRRAVTAALPALNAAQRLVLLGRMSGERLHVLGTQLGVTESRAHQLEKEAVAVLREKVAV